jgi:U3 small nucleolar RNA-associated protein 13
MSLGMQIVSAGADGLVKIWNIRDKECVSTLDNHDDRVWTLCLLDSESQIVSGSSDSTITIWKDVTTEELEANNKLLQDKIHKNQDLELFLQKKDYKSAVILALQLNQSYKILKIITPIYELTDRETDPSYLELQDLFSNLDSADLTKMLTNIRDWNTRSKHSVLSQQLLNLILKSYTSQVLMEIPNFKEILEGLSSYSTRHFDHVQELLKNSHLIGFTLECMDLIQ